jgi:hypothetical protein
MPDERVIWTIRINISEKHAYDTVTPSSTTTLDYWHNTVISRTYGIRPTLFSLLSTSMSMTQCTKTSKVRHITPTSQGILQLYEYI